MAHTDGIHTYFFEIIQAAFPYFRRHYGAKYTGIVVQTYTFDFHPIAVKCESFIRVKVQCAESYFGFTAVNALSVTE